MDKRARYRHDLEAALLLITYMNSGYPVSSVAFHPEIILQPVNHGSHPPYSPYFSIYKSPSPTFRHFSLSTRQQAIPDPCDRSNIDQVPGYRQKKWRRLERYCCHGPRHVGDDAVVARKNGLWAMLRLSAHCLVILVRKQNNPYAFGCSATDVFISL